MIAYILKNKMMDVPGGIVKSFCQQVICCGAVLLLFVSFVPTTAHADWYAGIRAGITDVSFDDIEVDSSPTNVGVLAGYEFSRFLPGLSAELEVTESLSDGEVLNSSLGVSSQGLYLAYRTGGMIYLKGRVGLMKAELTGDLAESENGESYGVAVGVDLPMVGLELDYTVIDDDIGYASVAVIYRF